MKLIKRITVILFSMVILVPLLTFNFEPESVSEIDNRMLAAYPFTEGAVGKRTEQVENFVSDRIGLRDQMILTYTVLHDAVFGKMVHPSYSYGKEGYVFGAGMTVNNPYTEFHESFADMVKSVQDYCDARNVPFLFVFDPAKPAVLREFIADGVNYDRSWVDEFFRALDARGVRYLDNTRILTQLHQSGEVVFNQKYDANHWNDWGAYHGCNAILQTLQEQLPQVHTVDEGQITLDWELKTSLPVSLFPIEELVPKITVAAQIANRTELYSAELERNSSYRAYGHYVNQELLDDGAPRALVFQGSYLNNFGIKYLSAGFGEYVYVHDYQNVMELPYYFNIFQPDCVIFEVAEYTFTQTYFSQEKMQQLSWNTALDVSGAEAGEPITWDSVTVEPGQSLTRLMLDLEGQSAWLAAEEIYDLRLHDGRFEVTVPNEVLDRADTLTVYVRNGDTLISREVHR